MGQAGHMAKHIIEGRLPFKKGPFVAARAFYRKKVAAEHFIESGDASSKSTLYTIIHNHVDVSIDTKTIDITTIVVCWVIHIIVTQCVTNIIVGMLDISLCSHGKRSQIPLKTHFDFFVFT